MAIVFYWRRRNLIGVALMLLGFATIIEVVPFYIGQYILLIDQFLILITPAIAGMLVIFFLLLESTEQLSRRLITPINRLYRPIIYSVSLVVLLRYVTYFISMTILLPLSVGWLVLDGPTWTYVLAQTISAIGSVALASRLFKIINKPR